MIAEHIKITLEKKHISYTRKDDSICFKHPELPEDADGLITWNAPLKMVQFVVDHEVALPTVLSVEAFAAILNELNYDTSWGNLETDGHGLVVYRLPTFLPDGRDAAVAVCSKALDFFLKAAVFRFRQVETELKKVGKKAADMDHLHSEEESPTSRVLELECLHHRTMQLAEAADILFEEFQLVSRDAMTQLRLGEAGKERVIRDARVLRQEEEKLHADIRGFAERYGLPVKLDDMPDGWSLDGFRQDLALTGFLNMAITDLFLALGKKDGHHAA